MVADFLVVNTAYLVAYSLYPLSGYFDFGKLGFKLFMLVNITWLISAFAAKVYSAVSFSSVEDVFRRTAKTAIMQALLFTSILWILKIGMEQKMFFVTYYGIQVALLSVSRFFFTYISEYIVQSKVHKKIAIVGYNETGVELARYFQGNNNIYTFEGFFDNGGDHLAVNEEGDVVGPIEECIEYAVENNIQEIYSTILPGQHEDVTKMIEFADRNCVRVKFVPAGKANLSTAYSVEYLGDFPVISLRLEPLQELKNRIKKRLADIAISSFVILFILSWLVPILAILIKLESKGPVFFKQLRSGRDNKPFWCYKFRSMRVNNNSDLMQATKKDARITKIGNFLRKTSLDEFPQFFNVFKGDMSIVGPRPHMLKHTEQYSALIHKYMIRQLLKPGITGWAQVNGYRGETKNIKLMEKRVEYDIYYMERWSSMLDIRIIFMTIINIFRGEENAY